MLLLGRLPPPDATLPAAIGEIVGGYRLDSVIARGGMGCVYAATHARLGRRAAVKVLVQSLAHDSAYVERFFNEARVVNAVKHPNIVDIFDFAESEQPRRVAYVMELIEGPPMSAVLAKQRLSMIQTVNASLQLVDALEAVHGIHVVHRDLKPDNVLVLAPLDSDFAVVPSVKVLDFGIAKITDPTRATSTMPGSIMGTPAYMSPEQISGTSITASADIYALGAMIYEMLTGKRLFPGEVMTVFKEKLLGRPASLALPDELEAPELVRELIASCVSPDPPMRPPLVEVRERLTDLLRVHGGKVVPRAVKRPQETKIAPPAYTLSPTISPTLSLGSLGAKKPRSGVKLVFAFAVLAAIGLGVGFALHQNSAPPPVAVPTPAAPAPTPPAPIVVPPPEEPEPEPEREPEKPKAASKKKAGASSKKKTAPIRRDDMVPW